MKRMHWWTLLALPGAGVAALLLGQAVWGQPETKEVPTKAPAPFVLPQPPTPGAASTPFPDMPAALSSAPTGQPATLPLPMPDLNQIPREIEGSPLSGPTLPALPTKQSGATLPVAAPAFRGDKLPAATMPKVSMDVQPGKQHPAVSIEWVGPPSVRINQPMTCQIVVKNTSATSVHQVVVRHRMAQGITCKSAEPAAMQDAGDHVWNLGTLAPQQSRRIELALIAHTRGVINCPATVTFTSVAAHQIQVREPQLVVKISGPDKVVVGDKVTLLVAISNPGDGAAESVKLKAMIPEGLEHPRGKLVEFDAGTIAAKESRAVQLVCMARGNGPQQCIVFATGDGNLKSKDTAQVDILMPKLIVAMNGPKMRYLERHAIYVLKVSNPGNAPARNVEVQEFIPSGFKFHQANHGGQYQDANRTVSWNLGEIGAGQTKELAVDLIPVEAGDHRLVVQAKALQGLHSETDLRTLVEGLPSLFIEVGHVDDPIEVGADTTYEIRIANNGTKTETNIEIVCTLPPELEFRDAKCSTTLRFRQEGRDLIFEPLARLAPRADVIFRVQARGVAPGDIRFRTRVRADGLKEPVLREESTRIYSDGAPIRPATITPQTLPRIPTTVPASNRILPTPGALPIPTPHASEPRVAPSTLPTTPSLPVVPNSASPGTLPAPPAIPLPAPSGGTNP